MEEPSVASPESINRLSPVPYYLQLAAILRAAIDRGEVPPGASLPSESELSKSHGISRTAIRNALDLLDREGRIRRVKGKRTVVSRRIPWDFELEYVTGYPRYVAPYRVGRLVELCIAPPEEAIAEALALDGEQPVLTVTTTYDGPRPSHGPAAVVRVWAVTDASAALQRLIDNRRLPELEVDGPSILTQLQQQFGVELAYQLTTVTPVVCHAEDAGLLGIPDGSLTLRTESVAHDSSGRPVVVVRGIPHLTNAAFRFIVRF